MNDDRWLEWPAPCYEHHHDAYASVRLGGVFVGRPCLFVAPAPYLCGVFEILEV
jgi:hypothetical protein